jgi:filamentous hemagglutinin
VTSAADATANTQLSVTGSLTNAGTLEVTSQAAVASGLSVSGGVLTNATGGIFSVLAGSGGGRALQAGTLSNAGTIDVAAGLSLDVATVDNFSGSMTLSAAVASSTSANWANVDGSITIVSGGSLTLSELNVFSNGSEAPGVINLDGGSASLSFAESAVGFSNGSGSSLSIGAGQRLTISGGVTQTSFNDQAGVTGTGSLILEDVSLPNLSIPSGLDATLTRVTQNPQATLTNRANTTVFASSLGNVVNDGSAVLNVDSVTVAGLVAVDGGLLQVSGGQTNTFSAGATVALGATLSVSPAAEETNLLIKASSSTLLNNAGTVELQSGSGANSGLILSADSTFLWGIRPLLNNGSLQILEGAGGTRTFETQYMTNNGTISINTPVSVSNVQLPASGVNWTNNDAITLSNGALLTVSNVESIVNTGTISLESGSLDITNVSGEVPGTFNQGGTLTLGAAQTLTVTNGVVPYNKPVNPWLETVEGTVNLNSVSLQAEVNTDIRVGSLTTSPTVNLTSSTVTLSTGYGFRHTALGTWTDVTAIGNVISQQSGALLTVSGNTNITGGLLVDNSGSLSVSAGSSLAVSNDIRVNSGSAVISATSVDANQMINNGGTLTFQTGEGVQTLSLASVLGFDHLAGTTTVSGTGSVLLNGALDVDAGTFTIDRPMEVAGNLDNAVGANVVIGAAGSLLLSGANGSHLNAGTITANGDLSVTNNLGFENSGTIDASLGDVSITNIVDEPGPGTFNQSGSLTLGAAQTLSVTGGNVPYDGAWLLSLSGTVSLSSVFMQASTQIASGAGVTFNLGSSTVQAPLGMAALGPGTWSDVSITGDVTAAPGSTLDLDGSTSITGNLTVNTRSSGILTVGGDALSVTGDVQIQSGGAGEGGRLSLGAASVTIGGALQNRNGLLGLNAALSGQTITVTGGLTQDSLVQNVNSPSTTVGGSGSLQINGATAFNGGTLTVNRPMSIDGNFTNAGTATIDPTGSLTLTANSGTHANSGSMIVNGPLTVTNNASFTNSGAIDAQAADITVTNAVEPSGVFTQTGSLTLGGDQLFSVTNGDLSHSGTFFGAGGSVSLINVVAEFVSGDSLGLGDNGPNTLNMSGGTSILAEAGIIVLPGTGGTWSDVTVNGPIRNSGTVAVLGTNTFTGTLAVQTGGVWDIQSGSSTFEGNVTNASGGQFTHGGSFVQVNGLTNSGSMTFSTAGVSELVVDSIFRNSAAGASVLVQGSGELEIQGPLDILAGSMTLNVPVSVFGDFRNRGLVRMSADLTVADDRTTADLPGQVELQDWAIAELGAQFVAVGGAPTLTVPAMTFNDVTMDGVSLVMDRAAFTDLDEGSLPHQAQNVTFQNMGTRTQITIREDSRTLAFNSIFFDQTDPDRVYLDVTDTDAQTPILIVQVNLDGLGAPNSDPFGYTISAGGAIISWLGGGQ